MSIRFLNYLEGEIILEKEIIDNNTEKGFIKIADEVVGIIAGLAAIEIDGIAGMSSGIASGIAEILGRKNLSNGVKVQVGEKEAAVDLYIIVDYGVRIPEVAKAVQENVKSAIENMTGLVVIEVNVHIQGVNFNHSIKESEEEN